MMAGNTAFQSSSEISPATIPFKVVCSPWISDDILGPFKVQGTIEDSTVFGQYPRKLFRGILSPKFRPRQMNFGNSAILSHDPVSATKTRFFPPSLIFMSSNTRRNYAFSSGTTARIHRRSFPRNLDYQF